MPGPGGGSPVLAAASPANRWPARSAGMTRTLLTGRPSRPGTGWSAAGCQVGLGSTRAPAVPRQTAASCGRLRSIATPKLHRPACGAWGRDHACLTLSRRFYLARRGRTSGRSFRRRGRRYQTRDLGDLDGLVEQAGGRLGAVLTARGPAAAHQAPPARPPPSRACSGPSEAYAPPRLLCAGFRRTTPCRSGAVSTQHQSRKQPELNSLGNRRITNRQSRAMPRREKRNESRLGPSCPLASPVRMLRVPVAGTVHHVIRVARIAATSLRHARHAATDATPAAP